MQKVTEQAEKSPRGRAHTEKMWEEKRNMGGGLGLGCQGGPGARGGACDLTPETPHPSALQLSDLRPEGAGVGLVLSPGAAPRKGTGLGP